MDRREKRALVRMRTFTWPKGVSAKVRDSLRARGSITWRGNGWRAIGLIGTGFAEGQRILREAEAGVRRMVRA